MTEYDQFIDQNDTIELQYDYDNFLILKETSCK